MAVHLPRHDLMEHVQPIRVIAYTRVNGPPADQARALALQWERMRQFLLDHAGWTLVGEFSDITTRRSANMLPGLRQAMAEVTAGGCDIFLVDSFDRVSRLCYEFTAVLDELTRTHDGLFTLQAVVALTEDERIRRHREGTAGGQRCRR